MDTMIGKRTARLLVVAALAVLALALWGAQASAQSQPGKPLFLLYGNGTTGDVVTVYDANGEQLGETTVDSDEEWHMSVNVAAEKLSTLQFKLNGKAADAERRLTGADQAEITLTASAMEDSEMMEDDMSEDGEMMEEDSEMMEEDSMMESDDDSMMDETYPASGSGGLAAGSPSTAALVGTLVLLGALLLGAGIYGVRRRA